MLAKRVKAVFSLEIRRPRFLGRIKQSKPYRLVVDFYLGEPLFVFFAHAYKTAAVIFSLSVLCVLGICRLPQIDKSVVSAVAVNVVKLMFWPFASHVKPCKPVRGIQHVVKTNANVPGCHLTSSFVPASTTPARLVPSKDAGFRAIIDKLVKPRLRYNLSFHDFDYINQVRFCKA